MTSAMSCSATRGGPVRGFRCCAPAPRRRQQRWQGERGQLAGACRFEAALRCVDAHLAGSRYAAPARRGVGGGGGKCARSAQAGSFSRRCFTARYACR